MSDHDPTDPRVGRRPDEGRVVSGEANLPNEHTARVRAAREGKGEGKGATVHRIHDRPDVANDDSAPSSTELAEKSRRARRRERDRRAEARAFQLTILGLMILAGMAFAAVQFLVDDVVVTGPDIELEAPPGADEVAAAPVPPPPAPRRSSGDSTEVDETSDIPALRLMRSEGLTIAAEGLPEVLTDATGSQVPQLAAVETCRFAYAVWEFSPNRRFRFLPTCEAHDGAVLYGAYEIDGEVVRMSPLVVNRTQLISEFHVARPSTMKTTVVVAAAQGPVALSVNQRVTTIRGGLEGERFRTAYTPKNTVVAPAARGRSAPRRAPPKAPPAAKADPLLDILKGEKR